MLKRKRSTRRLSLQFEILKRLELENVQGGASNFTNRCVSCIVLCTETCACPPSEVC